jgi:hypothetical protein
LSVFSFTVDTGAAIVAAFSFTVDTGAAIVAAFSFTVDTGAAIVAAFSFTVDTGAAIVAAGVAAVVVTAAGDGWLVHPAIMIVAIQTKRRINPIRFCIFF